MHAKPLALSCLAVAALLAPAVPAVAAPSATPVCTPDNCDFLFEYYSDASHTTRVGEYEDGPCGSIAWGQQTGYFVRIQRTC
ncbi:MAG TPA: hypothetical protein VMB79_09935 [Jatrophihabitans sp.]|nr:hypothetical protein [Jatrophihabitans sp.]